MIYLELFYAFFKIGLFGFGGGYAMLSLIETEVVTRHQWITTTEFTDIVAISQTTPGPIGINSATYVGYASTGNVWGAIVATTAVVLPSFLVMLLLSSFLIKHKGNKTIESIFKVLRPAVVGLLLSAALLLTTEENFGNPNIDPPHFIISACIFLASFIAVKRYKINAIYVIIVAGIIGFFAF